MTNNTRIEKLELKDIRILHPFTDDMSQTDYEYRTYKCLVANDPYHAQEIADRDAEINKWKSRYDSLYCDGYEDILKETREQKSELAEKDARIAELEKRIKASRRFVSLLTDEENERQNLESKVSKLVAVMEPFVKYCFCERPPYAGPQYTCDNCKIRKVLAEIRENKGGWGMSELLEKLAALEHEQWMNWAETIMGSEIISTERTNRWKLECMMPYSDLSEEMKEHDRKYARLAMKEIKSLTAEIERLKHLDENSNVKNYIKLVKENERLKKRETVYEECRAFYSPFEKWSEFTSIGGIFDEQDGDQLEAFNAGINGNDLGQFAHETEQKLKAIDDE